MNKPIVFFDIESTGLDVKNDRIVSIAFVKYEGKNKIAELDLLLNPQIPIPLEASEVHGIYDADVLDKPYFKDIANQMLDFIEGCDIAGFNILNYDCKMFYNEFSRVGMSWNYHNHNIIDVGNIYKIKEARTLSAASRFYLGKELEGAHGAMPDTICTAEVYFAQLEKYQIQGDNKEIALESNFGNEILDLSGNFTKNKEGQIIFNFGPHRGKLITDEKSFLGWMLSKDFPSDSLEIARKYY